MSTSSQTIEEDKSRRIFPIISHFLFFKSSFFEVLLRISVYLIHERNLSYLSSLSMPHNPAEYIELGGGLSPFRVVFSFILFKFTPHKSESLFDLILFFIFFPFVCVCVCCVKGVTFWSCSHMTVRLLLLLPSSSIHPCYVIVLAAMQRSRYTTTARYIVVVQHVATFQHSVRRIHFTTETFSFFQVLYYIQSRSSFDTIPSIVRIDSSGGNSNVDHFFF